MWLAMTAGEYVACTSIVIGLLASVGTLVWWAASLWFMVRSTKDEVKLHSFSCDNNHENTRSWLRGHENRIEDLETGFEGIKAQE